MPRLAAEAAKSVGQREKARRRIKWVDAPCDELLTEFEEDYFSQKSSSVPVMMLL